MFGLFRRKDVAEEFIWSDGRFLTVTFCEEDRELHVVFLDYCDRRICFEFTGVEQIQISEPIYCIRSEHSLVRGLKTIRLFDDDGVVLSFAYRDVSHHNKKEPNQWSQRGQSMPTPDDTSPETAMGRFWAGFIIATVFTFVGLGLYAVDEWRMAVIPALLVGCVVGAVSSWGKRIFAFFVELFSRYGL